MSNIEREYLHISQSLLCHCFYFGPVLPYPVFSPFSRTMFISALFAHIESPGQGKSERNRSMSRCYATTIFRFADVLLLTGKTNYLNMCDCSPVDSMRAR